MKKKENKRGPGRPAGPATNKVRICAYIHKDNAKKSEGIRSQLIDELLTKHFKAK